MGIRQVDPFLNAQIWTCFKTWNHRCMGAKINVFNDPDLDLPMGAPRYP